MLTRDENVTGARVILDFDLISSEQDMITPESVLIDVAQQIAVMLDEVYPNAAVYVAWDRSDFITQPSYIKSNGREIEFMYDILTEIDNKAQEIMSEMGVYDAYEECAECTNLMTPRTVAKENGYCDICWEDMYHLYT